MPDGEVLQGWYVPIHIARKSDVGKVKGASVGAMRNERPTVPPDRHISQLDDVDEDGGCESEENCILVVSDLDKPPALVFYE